MDLELKLYPDEVLTRSCQSVDDPEAYDDLIEEMASILYEKNGIGLAAPQVGKDMRLFLLRIDPEKRLHEAYFNPEIKSITEQEELVEGCLSFPNIEVDIERGLEVSFSALTPAGEEVERTVEGLQAQCVQHEVDHLEGKTLLDRCNLAQKMEINDRLKMLENGKIPPPLEKKSE